MSLFIIREAPIFGASCYIFAVANAIYDTAYHAIYTLARMRYDINPYMSHPEGISRIRLCRIYRSSAHA